MSEMFLISVPQDQVAVGETHEGREVFHEAPPLLGPPEAVFQSSPAQTSTASLIHVTS